MKTVVRVLIILGLSVLGYKEGQSQVNPDSVIRELNHEIVSAANDSIRILRLNDLAFFYQDYLDDKNLADSLSEAAVCIARMTLRNDLLILAYNRYVEVTDLSYSQQKAMAYATDALQLNSLDFNPRREWRVCRNLTEVCLEGYLFDKALAYANSAMKFAATLQDDTLRAESLLLMGRCLEVKNQRIEAFNHYLDAVDTAERISDDRILRKCYSRLSNFYKNIKLYGPAINYKNMEGLLILRQIPIDMSALMYVQYDLLFIDMEMNQNRLSTAMTDKILDFAVNTGNIRLKNFMLALYRKHLIEANDISELYDLYHKRFPDDLATMKAKDPTLFYRLQAFFNEDLNRPDSAEYYFRVASKLMDVSPNKVMRSNFYNRWGQFCLRQGKREEAVRHFKTAFDLASSVGYFNYTLSASRQMESVYRDLGNFREAYAYSALNRALADSINNAAKKEQVIMTEINRQTQVREEAAKREREATERTMRQRRLERNMMATGIAFMLILSFVIFRSYRLQKKYNRRLDDEKKRSDELLLNILPYETAEELKNTGTTEAKRFREVTVMFTDFKNFTQASEKMSAEELVKEIHSYYSEFDKIIRKYNIEKIKIIGDSYMCAGGLPVENSTHAFDVVSAALELQEFMASQRRIRQSHGRHFFELRIGIHTGPVVAGIVGIRKFAYDIWGDTVNTAARMENCGEVDRVNISGSTFGHIRDRFRCTYRGKVPAKHKGEIDMYFVEPF